MPIKILLTLLCFTLSHAAISGGYTEQGKITKYSLSINGDYIRVWFDRPIFNPGNCSKSDFLMRELNPNKAELENRLVAAIMSAKISGARVNFWVQGCTQKQHWGETHPNILSMVVE